MTDNPFESMLPYQQTSEYKARVLEVARLMMEHQRGITLAQVVDKMQETLDDRMKMLFQQRRSPDLVGSKLLYLSTWQTCLHFFNPDGVPSFPLAQELASESADQSVGLRAPSTEYRVYHDRQIFKERQRAAMQEWKVVQKQVVEDVSPPVAPQLPGNNTPQLNANHPGPSSTLAPPVVTKPQVNDIPKPIFSSGGNFGRDNSNPFAYGAVNPPRDGKYLFGARVPEAPGPEPTPKRKCVNNFGGST